MGIIVSLITSSLSLATFAFVVYNVYYSYPCHELSSFKRFIRDISMTLLSILEFYWILIIWS